MGTEVLLPGSSNPFWVLELVNYRSELTDSKCLQISSGKIHQLDQPGIHILPG